MVKQEFLLCFIIHISIDVDTNTLFYYNNVYPTSVVGDLSRFRLSYLHSLVFLSFQSFDFELLKVIPETLRVH
jgi:hypothetical protein